MRIIRAIDCSDTQNDSKSLSGSKPLSSTCCAVMKRISNTVAFIIICIVFILSGVRDIAGEVRKTKSVHLLGLFGMSGAWPSGHACLPATLMAIDQVNGREDLLPEHRLVLHWNDTQVGIEVNLLYIVESESCSLDLFWVTLRKIGPSGFLSQQTFFSFSKPLMDMVVILRKTVCAKRWNGVRIYFIWRPPHNLR